MLKVTDLGFSRKLHNGTMKARKSGPAGTCLYMSPEQLNQILSKKSDIWAFGCILLELSTGLAPFHDLEPAAVSMKVISKESPLEYALNSYTPEQLRMLDKGKPSNLRMLIEKCLSIDRQQRPSAREIICDTFFDDVDLAEFHQ